MANTYLQRSTTTRTNNQAYTFSCWFKRNGLNNGRLCINYLNSNNRGYIGIDSGNNLFLYDKVGGTVIETRTSNFQLTDTNGWYHYVQSVNTLAGGSGGSVNDRFKSYLNGVDISDQYSVSTGTGYNVNLGFQVVSGTNGFKIGSRETGADNFDGLMSHVHFVDGLQLPASTFGETDSTTGEWKIKTAPTISNYGNNGFFILKDSNSVTDQSGKSNNFTVGGGTITTTKDCPSNVFATLNPLMPLGSNIAYSNGNLTITPGTSDYKTTASTIAVSSGKFYTEFKAVSGHNGSTDVSIGIVGADTFLASTGSKAMSAYTNAFSYGSGGLVKQYNGSTIRTDATYTNGDIIGIAVDMDNLKLYWSKNGTFQNSGNPASGSTGTGAVSIPSGQPYYICATTISSGGVKVFSANFGNGFFGTTAITTNSGNGYAGAEGASKFNYQPPSGYSALSTKGLNQ